MSDAEIVNKHLPNSSFVAINGDASGVWIWQGARRVGLIAETDKPNYSFRAHKVYEGIPFTERYCDTIEEAINHIVL